MDNPWKRRKQPLWTRSDSDVRSKTGGLGQGHQDPGQGHRQGQGQVKMKLKDFMANTLPRAKKSKKKHTPLNNTLNNFSAAAPAPTTNKKDNVNRNAHPIQWSHSGSYVAAENRAFVSDWQTQGVPHSHHCDLSSRPDHFHYPDKRTPIDSVNFNIQTPERGRKCGCHKHVSPCSSPESWSTENGGHGSSSSGDGNFNTIPRCRTRIRTNPWLPSPRASPTPSATSSPLTSPSVFPDHTRRWLFPDQANGNSGSHDSSITTSRSQDSVNRPRRDSADSSPSSSTEADSLLQTSFCSDTSTDNSITANLGVDTSHSRHIEVSNSNSMTSTRYPSSDPWQTDPTSSSDDYDDAYESRRKERKSRKTRDSFLKSPDYFQPIEEEDSLFPDNCSRSRYETKHDLFREDNSNDSDGTLRGDENDMFLFEDTKLFDDSPQYDLRTIITDPDKENMTHDTDTNLTADSIDSAYDTCSFSEKASPQEPNRKLGDIRSSLQEKVLRLREEKYVVDEKIRQAQEEERIRQQEKMKFQKQVTMLRKQILLRTLHDLKRKLENQSQRLQTTYNSVMGMQWERARSRKRFASITPNLPRRNVIEHKESPF